jgi:hypothetical protein
MREGTFLFPAFSSLYECRAEVIIMHAPSTSDAYEAHVQPIESIVSLVLQLCRHPSSVVHTSIGTFPRGTTVSKTGVATYPINQSSSNLGAKIVYCRVQASKPAPTRWPVT